MSLRKMRFLLLAATVVLVVAVAPSIAFANFGPHGGYAPDTDQCAGCHRAHTAPSSATWSYFDGTNLYGGSALLLGVTDGSAVSSVSDACLTCHGPGTTGADTNVIDGVYMVRSSGGAYGTPGDPLISGPFGDSTSLVNTPYGQRPGATIGGSEVAVTSSHAFGSTAADGQGWGAWGGGIAGMYAYTAGNTWTGNHPFGSGEYRGTGQTRIPMDCASCHDGHGTSNYRMLKDNVYGVTVGGYNVDGTPNAWVVSAEYGFPANGFAKGVPTPADYTPNYTTPRYAKAPDAVTDGTYRKSARKGMSGWCTGCHTFYLGEGTSQAVGGDNVSRSTVYAAENSWGDLPGGLDSYGNVVRHRHPVNVALSNFHGPTTLVPNNSVTPLAHDFSERTASPELGLTQTASDHLDCLSCHYAHGTTATMVGYANVGNSVNPEADTGSGGVPPTDSSALLRANNRAVCQACHNK